MKITLTESEYVDRLLADSNARWSIGGGRGSRSLLDGARR